jgi:tRNA(Ile)-lysidine synthase
MTGLDTKFSEHVANLKMFGRGDRLLLAVSGGIDSVTLVSLCAEAGYAFEIAHVNFQLRGDESDRDENLVRSLAEKHNVKYHVATFDTERYAKENKISIQLAARQLRYSWFDELLSAETDAPDFLLTAHHRDDNIETAVFNFFRGTGISGLRGMLPKQNKVLRPLLIFSKQQLADHAKERGLIWREDQSNQSVKYSRNFIRNEFLPAVTRIIPEAEHNITTNIERFTEVEVLYEQAIALHRKRLLKQSGREFQIPVEALRKTEPLHTVLFELIRPFGFTAAQTGEVIKLMDAEQAAFVRSSGYRIIRNRKWLIIASLNTAGSGIVLIDSHHTEISLPEPLYKLRQQFKPGSQISPDPNPQMAFMDARELEYPLIMRKWKQGDYFYPLGMQKKKKVSKFLIGLKLSPTDKEKVYILQSGKKICWVMGFRIDDRFKVKESSQQVVVFQNVLK